MPDNNQNEALEKIAKQEIEWHFWFAAVFSAFLIIIVVYYLPARFLEQAGEGRGHPRENAMGEGVHGEENAAMDDMGDTSGMMHADDSTATMGEEVHDAGHAQGSSLYHEEGDVKEGLVINFNFSPVQLLTSSPAKLDFFVNEKPNNKPVTDLEISHEKFMHVIGVRSDLNEFFHVHPEKTADRPGFWSVAHNFMNPGIYKVWSDIKRGSTVHTFGHPQFAVGGSGAREEKMVEFLTNVIVGNYQVKLNYGSGIFTGRETDLVFEIRDLVGTPVKVEPFLAAQMHLAVIKDDLRQFMHAHPAEEGHAHANLPSLLSKALANGGDSHAPTDQISFHVTFPESGIYKLFAQFRPEGIDLPSDQSLVAGFYVQAEEAKPFFSPWWIKLFWSALAIIALSLAVKKYLKVPAKN